MNEFARTQSAQQQQQQQKAIIFYNFLNINANEFLCKSVACNTP